MTSQFSPLQPVTMERDIVTVMSTNTKQAARVVECIVLGWDCCFRQYCNLSTAAIAFVTHMSSPVVSTRWAMVPCWVGICLHLYCTCTVHVTVCSLDETIGVHVCVACSAKRGGDDVAGRGTGDAVWWAEKLKESSLKQTAPPQWRSLTCCPPGWWSCTSPR